MAPAVSVHAVPTVLAAAGQGWKQVGELALAFALSTLIGLEREWRAVTLEVEGKPPIESLAAALDDVDGVLEVTTSDLAQGAD
jgi:hypothetical protein